jgi:hypothetical protein
LVIANVIDQELDRIHTSPHVGFRRQYGRESAVLRVDSLPGSIAAEICRMATEI